MNNDLFCDMAALVALDDTSLREAAATREADGALVNVIAKAADGAAAAGRRLLRQVLSGNEGAAAGREAALQQPSGGAGSRLVSSRGREVRSSDSSIVHRLQQQLRWGRMERRLQQAEAQDEQEQQQRQQEQQQQQQQQQQQEESAADESAAETQAQPSGEDAAQQAEQSGLPVMSGEYDRRCPAWHDHDARPGKRTAALAEDTTVLVTSSRPSRCCKRHSALLSDIAKT